MWWVNMVCITIQYNTMRFLSTDNIYSLTVGGCSLEILYRIADSSITLWWDYQNERRRQQMEKAEMQVQEEFENNCTFHPKVSVFHSSYCWVIYLCPCVNPALTITILFCFVSTQCRQLLKILFLIKVLFSFQLIFIDFVLNKVAGNVLNR